MDLYDIILDTNVVFSALYSNKGASFKVFSLIGTGKFAIHLSVPLVLEYEEKLKENRRLFGLTLTDIDDLIDFICSIIFGNSFKPFCMLSISKLFMAESKVSLY